MIKRRKLSGQRKPPGKPFKPGSDPRRHMAGRKCKDAIAFGQEFNRALAGGGDPTALAALLWRRALAGRPWAIELILDRLLGKLSTMTILPQGPPTIYRIVYAEDPKGPANTDPAVLREQERQEHLGRLIEQKGKDHDPSKN